ncbi:MAG: hypothetical protein VKK62_00615 [Synechococcaceae cyanobacterium]|nr:hypothetical protein [Synechococcaceae cyanobacterium]
MAAIFRAGQRASLASGPRCASWLAAVLLLPTALLASLPAAAGSVTAESIWDRRNARQMALQQIPRGSRILRSRCTDIGISTGDWRYRCTVWYEPPAPAPDSSAPAMP